MKLKHLAYGLLVPIGAFVIGFSMILGFETASFVSDLLFK